MNRSDAQPPERAERAVPDRRVFVCRKLDAGRRPEIRERYGSLSRVQADIGPMERIVADLLRTTLDAMPGDGTVELTAEQKGEAAAVTVSTAAGVSEIGRPGPVGRYPRGPQAVQRPGGPRCGRGPAGRGWSWTDRESPRARDHYLTSPATRRRDHHPIHPRQRFPLRDPPTDPLAADEAVEVKHGEPGDRGPAAVPPRLPEA